MLTRLYFYSFHHDLLSWVPAGFFSRGEQIRGLGTKVPQTGPRVQWGDWWGNRGDLTSRSRRQFVKITHK